MRQKFNSISFARIHAVLKVCWVPIAVAVLCVFSAHVSSAAPLSFTLFNVSTSNQSRLEMVAAARLSGSDLTSVPQYAPGVLNGAGSLSTLYSDTAANDSNLNADVTQYSIDFPGGSTAVASNARGILGDLAMSPNVGGTSGTAPANYGVKFTSPQSTPIPPIDLTPFGINATLNLGTVTSLDWTIAFRNIVIDVTSAELPLAPGATYPQSLDSSQLNIEVAGTADSLFGATVKQASIADYLATGIALAALQPTLAAQGITLTIVNNGFLQQSYTIGFGTTTPLPPTSVANADTSLGLLEHVGSNLRLTLPVKFDIVPSALPAPFDTLLTAHFGLSGKLIGQTPYVSVAIPEPGTKALLLAVATTAYSMRRPRHS